MLGIIFTSLVIVVVLCLPFLLWLFFGKIRDHVDSTLAWLKYERKQIPEEEVDSEKYRSFSRQIDRNERILSVLKPTNKVLEMLGTVYVCIAITLFIVDILVVLLGSLGFGLTRWTYKNLDGQARYYESIPAVELQSTTIKKAEEINDNIKNSIFITREEKASLRLIDTQTMWAKFEDSVGEKRAKDGWYGDGDE